MSDPYLRAIQNNQGNQGMTFRAPLCSYRAILMASAFAALPLNAAMAESADEDSRDILVIGSIESGTIAALEQQRAADNSINVVSSDDVGRFPDPNIAEALQRVPGIAVQRDQGEGRYINIRGGPADFSSVSVDGVTLTAPDPSTRAIDLDTIPSDVISTLEVSKTLLPSQDADAITGTVNITTRSAFDKKGTNLSGSFGMSHNDFGGNDVRGSAFVSSTFADDRWGAVLSGSYSRTDRRVDNIESVWGVLDTPEGGEVLGLVESLFKDYDTRRERIAFTGALEFEPSDNAKYYVRGSYSRFEDDEYRNQLLVIWEDGDLQPGATDASATFSDIRIAKQFRHRVQRNEIMTLTAGGENDLGGAKLDYNVAWTTSDQTYPSRNELLYRSSLRPTASYDFSANPDQPAISLFNSGEHLNQTAYGFRENTYRANTTENEEFSTAFNVSFPVDDDFEIKVGARYRDRTVTADEERWRDRRASSAPAGSMADFLSDRPSSNYDYDLGFKFDPSLAKGHLLDLRDAGLTQRRIPQSITADYAADEKVLAGYVMTRATFGATDVILGLRMEKTRFDGSSPTFNETTEVIGEEAMRKRYTNWFPNLTVRHNFTDNLVGRAAVTRGINRPNFLDLVPRIVENTEGATIRVTRGNPLLEPTISTNFDASLDYYIDRSGVVSAGFFYKDIKDFRFEASRTGTYLGLPAEITQPENAPDGYLYGFEVNLSQKLRFLPGFLANFGVFANYTYTSSRINLAAPYAGRDRYPLPGQSKHVWNASVYYETSDFSARLAYTKRSAFLSELNADDGRFDIYWGGRGQLDFTTSYKLNDNVTVFGEAKNLSNSAGVRYFGTRERVYEYEKFGYSLFGGVKVNF
jgi:TonB-dependent receptor